MNGIGTALLAVQTICAVILVGLFFLSRKGQASPVSEKSFQCQKEDAQDSADKTFGRADPANADAANYWTRGRNSGITGGIMRRTSTACAFIWTAGRWENSGSAADSRGGQTGGEVALSG